MYFAVFVGWKDIYFWSYA